MEIDEFLLIAVPGVAVAMYRFVSSRVQPGIILAGTIVLARIGLEYRKRRTGAGEYATSSPDGSTIRTRQVFMIKTASHPRTVTQGKPEQEPDAAVLFAAPIFFTLCP